MTAYNLGVRRETSPQIAARLLREAEPRLDQGDAHGVVFAGGVNDATVQGTSRRVEEAQSLAALAEVARTCADRGWSLLVVGPAPIADPAQTERIVALSAALAASCDTQGIPFVPLAAHLAQDAAWMEEVASLDGAHPTANGYGRLTDLIWPGFDRWMTDLASRG